MLAADPWNGPVEQQIATRIESAAKRVRKRDFLWAGGAATGVSAVALLTGTAPLVPLLPGWAVVIACLVLRYRLGSGREWTGPVQQIVDAQLSAQEEELSDLRQMREVLRLLPAPIFVLDDKGVVRLINPAAEEFAGGDVEGRHISAVLRAPSLLDAVNDVFENGERQSVDFSTMGAVERYCRADIDSAVLTEGRRRVLLHINDLTAERRLERLRADFIASASHELRTPLAAMLGFIETLRGHARDDAEARDRFLKIMQSQAERMKRLVADLMSLSRIELNEHVAPDEDVDVAAAVADVIDGLSPIIRDSGIRVVVDNACGAPAQILGDRDEIVQVIQNLLDNALRYSGDVDAVALNIGCGPAPAFRDGDDFEGHRAGDTAAQVAARHGVATDDLVYIQVSDEGVGIERSDLPRITERFYRVDVEHSRAQGGTGLGLAIVKHIVNRHKGGFQVESLIGAGAAFTCYFPKVDPACGKINAPIAQAAQ